MINMEKGSVAVEALNSEKLRRAGSMYLPLLLQERESDCKGSFVQRGCFVCVMRKEYSEVTVFRRMIKLSSALRMD